MNSQPNKYQEQVLGILTKPKTKMWVFYRPPIDSRNLKEENKITPGFRVIHGNFLISFK